MMRSSILLLAPFAGLASSQRVGTLVSERHPPLRWFRCIADGSCQPVDGELVLDANWRWLHEVSGTRSCYEGNSWNSDVCRTSQACTANCALEGAQYREYGIIAPATASDNTSVIQRLRTNLDSRYNKGSRMFLLESRDRYQTFTLLDHELAFDVDLSTVECGINAALKFVPMDADGGQARDKGNEAGAAYGTGYCDASCPRDLHFVPERGANVEQWTPSNTDLNGGQGYWGSCCPQMSVWNSNVHSFSVSTHTCAYPGREEQGPWICEGQAGCDPFYIDPQERGRLSCDYFGCSFNPYRMGNPWFYGKGKRLDTTRKFTVITRFSETNVTQFFVQDGRRINVPTPFGLPGLPPEAGLSDDMCFTQPAVFEERGRFTEIGGWLKHIKQILTQPMVLTFSIGVDHLTWNTWLDSIYPPYDPATTPGRERGPCPVEENDPRSVEQKNQNAQVIWSNIRFGPIGSTVRL